MGYIQGRQLPYINPTKTTLTTYTTGADGPEAFIQLKFKNSREQKSITMQTLFGCAVFGSKKNSGLLQRKNGFH